MTTAAQKVDVAMGAAGGPAAAIKRMDPWPALAPLPEDTQTKPGPFPFNGLGKVLGDAARSIARGVQAPDALAGGSVLASAALAVQARRVRCVHGRQFAGRHRAIGRRSESGPAVQQQPRGCQSGALASLAAATLGRGCLSERRDLLSRRYFSKEPPR